MVHHEQSLRMVAKALGIGENPLHRYNRSALGHQSTEDFERVYSHLQLEGRGGRKLWPKSRKGYER
jgi:hypothetical protein